MTRGHFLSREVKTVNYNLCFLKNMTAAEIHSLAFANDTSIVALSTVQS